MRDLDCANCGLAFNAACLDGLVYDGDERTCSDCGAVNVVAVDIEYAEQDTIAQAYVGHWRCTHGVDGETECAACATDEKHKHRASE